VHVAFQLHDEEMAESEFGSSGTAGVVRLGIANFRLVLPDGQSPRQTCPRLQGYDAKVHRISKQMLSADSCPRKRTSSDGFAFAWHHLCRAHSVVLRLTCRSARAHTPQSTAFRCKLGQHSVLPLLCPPRAASNLRSRSTCSFGVRPIYR
jgi:hypothetical protein